MTTVTFKTGITEEQGEEICQKIEKIIERWFVYSSENPTKEQQSAFHKLLYQFYCLPNLDLHDQWEEFRKPYYEAERDKRDDLMLERMNLWKQTKVEESEYSEPVILRFDVLEQIDGTIDMCLVCAKEFWMGVDRWSEKYGFVQEMFIYKSKHPKTFEWCKVFRKKS